MSDKAVVLVTGTSTGIGRQAVGDLRDAGFLVVATARRLSDIKDLAKVGEVECLRLDVTKESSMQKAVDTVLERHGRIDALVNNAGYGAYYPMEETTLDTMHAMFDVNVFGLHRLTQLVLPHMRKRGHGRIVNVSSVAGHLSIPMMGTYCATKFAVRAMSQALRVEVKPLGIHVSLVEPGRIKTAFGRRARSESPVDPEAWRTSPYEKMYRRWNRMDFNSSGAHPRVIGKRIVKACKKRRPRFHYIAPLDGKAGAAAKRLLPDAWLNWMMARWFGV